MCLTNEMLCDGYDDCDDKSDEEFERCTVNQCKLDEFVCGGVDKNITGTKKRFVPWRKKILKRNGLSLD